MAKKAKNPAGAKARAKAAKAAQPAVATNMYDAAGAGRRMRGWHPSGAGPNRALDGAQAIRNRARDTSRNEWIGAAARSRWGANLVGTGILARPKTADKTLRLYLAEIWDAWTAECDADNVLDLYGLQTLIATNWVEAGEVFVRLRPRRLTDGLSAPLQLQVLEAEMVPPIDFEAGFTKIAPGHYIRQGIEFDRIGRRVAYWVYRDHPGDRYTTTGNSIYNLQRVPAAQMLHIFEPLRPGQLRGISAFAPVLPKTRSVGNFDDAVLSRQELANLYAMFVTRPESGAPHIDPLTGQAVTLDPDGPIAALEPGISQELAPGEDVKFSDPPDAGTNYADYMRHQHQYVAAGIDLPYELLTGDVRDISDRTLRVVVLEFRRRVQQRQWQILIPQLCRKVRAAWVEACLLAGTLTEAQAIEARRVEWAPQGWEYLHPVQDVTARKLQVRAGFKSRSQVQLEQGDDPWTVEQEIHADNTRADDLGITLESDGRQTMTQRTTQK